MDWERTGRIAGKFFLLFLEYCFKISATVVALTVLAAPGTFSTKLQTGFASLSPVLRQLVEAPGKIFNKATVINDYHTLTAASFNDRYGAQAVEDVLAFMNEGILYVQAAYQNLTNQPFSTFAATGIAFITLYLLGRVLRFARQKGRGSFLHRFEQKIGDRVFRSKKTKKPRTPLQTSHQVGEKKSPPQTARNPRKRNNYLKQYIKSHQTEP